MTQFTTDHIFNIGTQHLRGGKPCEDYAFSGNLGDAAYAIVSDGCSCGDKTDIGARLICLSTAQVIEDVWSQSRDIDVRDQVMKRQTILFASAASHFGLTIRDMLATSVYAVLSESGAIAHVCGDGVIATSA